MTLNYTIDSRKFPTDTFKYHETKITVFAIIPRTGYAYNLVTSVSAVTYIILSIEVKPVLAILKRTKLLLQTL